MAARDVDGLHFRRALGSTLRSRGVAFEVVVVDHGSLVPIVVDTRPSRKAPAKRLARDR